MSRIKLILFLFGCALSTILFGQKEVIRPDIQYVTLDDTLLLSALEQVIEMQKERDTLFAKGIGYLSIGWDYISHNGNILPNNQRIDTVRTFDAVVSYMHPEASENKFGDQYPMFYTFVSDRLVTMGSQILEEQLGHSERSKSIYRRVVNRYLEPPGAKSRRIIRLDKTYIYILQNRFTGKYESPVLKYVELEYFKRK